MSLRADPRIGSELAGYRIERLLGRGGMSVVYLADDLRLERRVALKLLAPELAEDERFRERFLRESRLAASIDHPNVIPIYEAGEAQGLLYIAMRYVEGTDLKRLLEQEGRLEPARALGLLSQVAEALDVAHERGLIHRDVKPGNVLISSQAGREHVYLSDFGLTKQTGSETGLTETGQFMGTADYVSPEQVERQPVTAAGDVYSLGCVLYECLAGQPPYSGGRLVGTLFAHVSAPIPSVREHRPELPEGIDAVVARALAKGPFDRHPTCRELVEEARRALDVSGDAGLPLEPPVPARPHRWLLLVALVLVAAAAVAAILVTRGGEEGAGPEAKPILPLTGDSLVRIDPATGELVAAVPLGARPDAVAVGEGAVWAVSSNDGVLLRVDPGTGRVLKTVSLDHIGAPDRLAAGEGSVWIGFFVSSSSLPGQWVWRYEPSGDDLSPVGTLRTVPAALAAGLGWLWITDLAGPRVLRVQPDSGELVSSVDGIEPGIAIGDDAVWAWDGPDHEVSRIDPESGEAVLAAEPGFIGFDIAAAEGAVWLLDQAGEAVWRLDPATNRMSEAFPTGRIPKSIAAGESAVWVGNTRDGTVTRFDPQTADVESIDVGGIPTSIAVGEDAVWVAVDAR